MKLLLIVIIGSILPLVMFGQVKDEFQEKLRQERQKNIFIRQLIQLDSVFKDGIDTVGFRHLAASGQFDYVSFKTVQGNKIVILDIIPLWAEAYMQLESDGKINALKKLRTQGRLRITSRDIANEVEELPKKSNPNQSYSDFYIGVIKQLMIKYKTTFAPDQLDFAIYQSWEKEANLGSDTALREYREAFIKFLYSHYHLQ